MPADLSRLVSPDDFRDEAQRRLDPPAWSYYSSGALTEWTLRENERAFQRWCFDRRVLVDVSSIDVSTTVLGTSIASPVLIAPTAFHRLADPEGEVATARAAATVDTIMVNSTLSTVTLEDVAATGAKRWFQLYVFRDRGRTRALVDRAVAAGFSAIVLTVDAPRIGIRYADQRDAFQLPDGLDMATLRQSFPARAEGAGEPASEGSGLRAFSEQFDPSLTWADLEWLVEVSKLPVVVKGVLSASDARRSIESGARGIVVSNHGGRQLDGDPATLDVLPEIAAEVGDETTLLLDGGVRTGPDVVKAIALGARAVLVGRPVLWGLACGGEAGVARVLGLLRVEIEDTLAQLGVPSLDGLGPSLLRAAD